MNNIALEYAYCRIIDCLIAHAKHAGVCEHTRLHKELLDGIATVKSEGEVTK